MKKLEVLLRRPDFQRNPVLAIWKRLYRRARWTVNPRPWLLPLGGGRRIASPRGGSGALIYYQGCSEPETADFLRSFLRPGMTFLDIGAHIGEYVVLAAVAVRPGGMVHAFEPSPEIFALLQSNILMNGLQNVRLHQTAVSGSEGTVLFEICSEPAISALRAEAEMSASPSRAVLAAIPVATTTLDAWWEPLKVKIDLVKIDVEGAELSVLRGAEQLLSLPAPEAPVLVLEYSPENYARFGYEGSEIEAILKRHRYELFQCATDLPLAAIDIAQLSTGTTNLLATKSPGRVEELISAK